MKRNDANTTIETLTMNVKQFLNERDWEKFHNPKDLAESICIEAAELLQIFQWVTSEESALAKTGEEMQHIEDELADVVIYCISMANRLDIDLTSTVLRKIQSNRRKYPVNQYKGRAK